MGIWLLQYKQHGARALVAHRKDMEKQMKKVKFYRYGNHSSLDDCKYAVIKI